MEGERDIHQSHWSKRNQPTQATIGALAVPGDAHEHDDDDDKPKEDFHGVKDLINL